MQKQRPVVVISSDSLRDLPLRVVAPITGWKDSFDGKISHVKLETSNINNLKKSSAVAAIQLRCISLERFVNKIGKVTANQLEEIVAAIAAVIEYQ